MTAIKLAVAAPETTDLDRFEAGEITEAQFLARRIEVATSHLRGRLSRTRLELIVEVVSEMLETDPVLVAIRDRVLARGRELRGHRGASTNP
jgi:hypothetical protein